MSLGVLGRARAASKNNHKSLSFLRVLLFLNFGVLFQGSWKTSKSGFKLSRACLEKGNGEH